MKAHDLNARWVSTSGFRFQMQSSVSIWSKSPPGYLRTHSGGVAVAYSKMAPLYYGRKAWSAKMRMQIKLRTNFQVCFLILLGRLYLLVNWGTRTKYFSSKGPLCSHKDGQICSAYPL